MDININSGSSQFVINFVTILTAITQVYIVLFRINVYFSNSYITDNWSLKIEISVAKVYTKIRIVAIDVLKICISKFLLVRSMNLELNATYIYLKLLWHTEVFDHRIPDSVYRNCLIHHSWGHHH